MSQSLENKLRAALRPVDPGEDFTQRVLARLPEVSATERARAPSQTRRFSSRAWWVGAAMAASLVAAIAIGIQNNERHEREAGLRAKAQLLEALQLTSEKLNLAVRVVHDQSERTVDDSGA